ncbi:unnamed protein product [Pleuronectes platessa]|uniref:MIF4G domain-containing protein n=1 Tax=Pleuronectes platessa TaxID=8262 RepID=A0A9N7VJR2_PLEPL|nr:unnamed protein product [Pleuronectes platessa]
MEEKKTMPLMFLLDLDEKKPAMSVLPVRALLRSKTGSTQAEPEQPHRQVKRLRFVVSVLSELTPEPLQDSITQLKTLHLSTEESLKEVVNLTFEKAMVRPNDSLPKWLLTLTGKSKSHPQLIQQLLSTSKLCLSSTAMQIVTASCNDLNGKKETTLSRSVSTIQLMGELYRTYILSQAVMHSCIKGLINKQDAESLESLCELFKVIGQDLEVVTAIWVMNSYYNQMEVMAKEEKMSPRISLMLKKKKVILRNETL